MKSPESPNSPLDIPVDPQPSDENEDIHLGKKSVRVYSQRHSQEERDTLAEEAKTVHENYWNRIKRLEDSLNLISGHLEKKDSDKGEVVARLQKIEEELGLLEKNSFNSFLSLLHLNRKEQNLKNEETYQASIVDKPPNNNHRHTAFPNHRLDYAVCR